jgi:hypothetical protein
VALNHAAETKSKWLEWMNDPDGDSLGSPTASLISIPQLTLAIMRDFNHQLRERKLRKRVVKQWLKV